MVQSAVRSLVLVASFVFATTGLAGTQADAPDLPQPMVERMINELLDRLSASAEEIELASAFEIIVCDRAILDNYAYLVNAAGRQPALEELVRAWMATYHLLVKVPVVAPPPVDTCETWPPGQSVPLSSVRFMTAPDSSIRTRPSTAGSTTWTTSAWSSRR